MEFAPENRCISWSFFIMKILMISDLERIGGAAIAASRIASALAGEGSITRVVAVPDSGSHPWKTISLGLPQLARRIGAKVAPSLWSSLSGLITQKTLVKLLDTHKPDIINIHNLHSVPGHGWSIEMVSLCAERAPTVWTLHDMWSFTGGCAYTFGCERFIGGCDASCNCLDLHPKPPRNRLEHEWNARKELFSEFNNLVGVTPSTWLAEQAKRGLWSTHRIEVIPNPLPFGIYRPNDEPDEMRNQLGIPEGALIGLVVAQMFADPRKGASLLIEALRIIRHRPLAVVSIGMGALQLDLPGIVVKNMGHIGSERDMVALYNVADLLIHPAMEENFSNVILESIACGTPAVAFSVGGNPEIVQPGITGWLVPEISAHALAAKIDEALADISTGRTLRESCRERAEERYTSEANPASYMQLFSSLLK